VAYFANKNQFKRNRKPNGGVAFDEIRDVFVDHERIRANEEKPRFVFKVNTCQRVYVLSHFAAEVMRIWIDVIFTGAHERSNNHYFE